jgi:hypothetical protein
LKAVWENFGYNRTRLNAPKYNHKSVNQKCSGPVSRGLHQTAIRQQKTIVVGFSMWESYLFGGPKRVLTHPLSPYIIPYIKCYIYRPIGPGG